MSASRPILLALVLVLVPRLATSQGVALTPEQMAVFLTKAAIVSEKSTSAGTTRPVRATLSDGVVTHDAQFQTVDQAMGVFTAGKASEVDFKDTYRFNIAGYRLAQLVGIETVPMSVQRRYKGKEAAVTWWIDDVMFDESGRQKLQDKLGPDPERTQKQIYVMAIVDIGPEEITFRLRHRPGSFDAATTRFAIDLDIDQNSSTGSEGIDYQVFVFPADGKGADVARTTSSGYTVVGTVPVTFVADGCDVAIPRSFLGGDDGRFDFRVRVYSQPALPLVLDVLPDNGLVRIQ